MSPPDFDIADLYFELRRLLAQVPAGKVTTCGALAAALGSPMAARWIGHFLLHHEHDADCVAIACRAGGRLGGYVQGDAAAKCRRLAAEGVEVCHDLVDLALCRPRPLCLGASARKIAANSGSFVGEVVIEAPPELPLVVGGVDVSYPPRAKAWPATRWLP